MKLANVMLGLALIMPLGACKSIQKKELSSVKTACDDSGNCDDGLGRPADEPYFFCLVGTYDFKDPESFQMTENTDSELNCLIDDRANNRIDSKRMTGLSRVSLNSTTDGDAYRRTLWNIEESSKFAEWGSRLLIKPTSDGTYTNIIKDFPTTAVGKVEFKAYAHKNLLIYDDGSYYRASRISGYSIILREGNSIKCLQHPGNFGTFQCGVYAALQFTSTYDPNTGARTGLTTRARSVGLNFEKISGCTPGASEETSLVKLECREKSGCPFFATFPPGVPNSSVAYRGSRLSYAEKCTVDSNYVTKVVLPRYASANF